MIEKEDCICVGICARPHGVNGEILLRANKGFSIEDLSYEFLHIELDGGLVPFYVDEIRTKNNEEALVKFEGIMTQEQARKLADASVYIERSWIDNIETPSSSVGNMIGYMAYDHQTKQLGQILEIQEIAKNPLFIVDFNGQELLIPIVEDFIERIDHPNHQIFFQLPEGLLEL